MSTRLASRHQQGLTMVELIMFIVIVSVAVVGVLGVLSYTNSNSVDPQMRKQALAIAEGLLEEVELARFTFCEPNDDAAETAVNTAGCASTIENWGPEPARLPFPADARPFDNVNDYVSNFNALESAFDVGGALADGSGTPIGVPGYTAKLMITPEALNGIASDEFPATMNVLRITVVVTYNNGRDSITLEGYRTRYAPNAIP